jgi:hypothetical protein
MVAVITAVLWTRNHCSSLGLSPSPVLLSRSEPVLAPGPVPQSALMVSSATKKEGAGSRPPLSVCLWLFG